MADYGDQEWDDETMMTPAKCDTCPPNKITTLYAVGVIKSACPICGYWQLEALEQTE